MKDHVTPISFTTKIEKVMSDGGWHIISLSPEITQKLRDQAGKNGNVPIVVTIGKTTYHTTIMSRGQQRWYFAAKASVRKAENLSDGDVVTAIITPDFDKLGRA